MKRLLFCFVLCLPLALSATDKKKAKSDEEKIVYRPSLSTDCPRPQVIKGKTVLKAFRDVSNSGGGREAHEVVFTVKNENGKKKLVIISSENYAVNARGVRIGERRSVTDGYIRWCLRYMPEDVRTLFAGRESAILINPAMLPNGRLQK